MDKSTWNDKKLLGQLILLADSGFRFHLSRLVNSPEELQYMQVLFILSGELDLSGSRIVDRYRTRYLQALPKLLGLPESVSYTDINQFVTGLYVQSSYIGELEIFFEGFQRDPARSGAFHHDPEVWHTFAATRFLRFLAKASSQ